MRGSERLLWALFLICVIAVKKAVFGIGAVYIFCGLG